MGPREAYFRNLLMNTNKFTPRMFLEMDLEAMAILTVVVHYTARKAIPKFWVSFLAQISLTQNKTQVKLLNLPMLRSKKYPGPSPAIFIFLLHQRPIIINSHLLSPCI